MIIRTNLNKNTDDSYDIVVKRGILQEAGNYLNLDRKVMIVTDSGIPEEYIKTLEKHNYSSIVDLEINDSMYWEDPHTPHKQTVDYLRTFIPEE